MKSRASNPPFHLTESAGGMEELSKEASAEYGPNDHPGSTIEACSYLDRPSATFQYLDSHS